MYLFTYTDSAEISTAKLFNILRLGIFNSFGLYHPVKLTCFSERRFTASMYSKIKEQNKILTAYD